MKDKPRDNAHFLGAHHQISGEGGGQFFCVGIVLVVLGLHGFLFWPVLGFFLVVALLHDFCFLLLCLARVCFGNCPPPSPEI